MRRMPEPRRAFLRAASRAVAGASLVPRALAAGAFGAAERDRAAAASDSIAPLDVAVASSGAGPVAPADAWPQFRGTPTLSGLSAATLPRQLKVAWRFEAGDAIESSAAIAGGAAYVGTRKGELVALDLATGKPLWRYAVTGDGVGESSPCADGGAVFVGDLAGVVHAVDAKSGRALWTHKTGMEIKSSPVVSAGRILIGSYDQSLYALDAKSGMLAWKRETEGPVHATPAVADGVTYVAGCDEVLRAIRVTDGSELYQVASGGYTGASAALGAGRAFYGTFENEVLAVDLQARKPAWRYEHPERKFPFYSSAALPPGRVILGGRDKLVHCLDAATGRSQWTFATRARVDSSPAVASGRVYVGSSDGRLYVLELATGALVQEHDLGAPLTASPALAASRLVIGTEDGLVACFR